MKIVVKKKIWSKITFSPCERDIFRVSKKNESRQCQEKKIKRSRFFLYTITTQNVKLCEKTKQISMERNSEFWGTIWSHGTCSGVNLLHTVPILWKMHLWKMLRMSQDCCGIDWSATFTCKITLVIEDYMIYSLNHNSSWKQNYLSAKMPCYLEKETDELHC